LKNEELKIENGGMALILHFQFSMIN